MVNVTDFANRVPPGDKLETIFKRQTELMEKYDVIEEKNIGRPLPTHPLKVDDPRAQERIKDFMWRITEELGEAANCLKNKPWKTTHIKTDEVHFLEEIIDGFHFYTELLILLGFNPDSLVMLYLNKNDVNLFRIRSNY